MLSKVKTIFILYIIINNNCISIEQNLHTWLKTGFKANTVSTDVTTAKDPPPINHNLTLEHLKKFKKKLVQQIQEVF